MLTFPCNSVRSDGNDLAGDLDPIFCDGSFLFLSELGLIAIVKLCAAAALDVVNADKWNEDYIIDWSCCLLGYFLAVS